MSDTIHSATLRITGDSSEAVAAIAQVEKRVDNLATHATTAGKTASDGVKQIASGAGEGAKGVDRATQTAINAIQRQTAAQMANKDASIEQTLALAKLRGVNQSALEPHIATFNASGRAMQKARQEAALLNGTMNKTGLSAKQMAFSMRGVPAQMTDIVVSLQSGQKPLTVLFQQGGQLKDMFGGIGNAAKAMGSYVLSIAPKLVHPFTIGVAAVAAYGYAVYEAAAQHNRLTQALVSTGKFTGKTQSETQQISEDVGKLTGKYSDAQEAAERLTASGKITGQQLKTAMIGVVEGAAVTGMSIEDMSKKFIDMADKPTEIAKEMQKQYGFLTVAQFEEIKSLEEIGKRQEAATVLFKAYADTHTARRGEIQENLGYIMQAWKDIKEGIGAATVALVSFGRKQSDVDRRKEAQANLDLMVGSGNAALSEQISQSKAYIAQLDIEIAKKDADTKTTAKQTQERKKGIEASDEVDKYLKSKRHGTKSFLLEEEDKAFAKATANVEKGSKDYIQAVAAHNQAKEKINKQFEKKGSTKSDNFDRGEMGFSREIAGIEFAIKNFDRFDGRVQSSKEAMAEFDVSPLGKFSDKMREKAKLPILTEEQKAAYVAEGKALDAVHDKLRRVNVAKEFSKSVNDFIYDENKHREGMQFEIDMLGKTEIEISKLTEARRIDLSVQDRIKQVREKYGKDTGDDVQERLSSEIERLKMEGERAKSSALLNVQTKYEEERDPWLQMTKSLQKYNEEATNVGKQVGDVMTNSIKGMEDALVNFVKTGKFNWSSLSNYIIGEIARIQIKAMLSGIFGSSNGSGIIGSVISMFGGGGNAETSYATSDLIASVMPSAKGNIFDKGNVIPFSKGGTFSNKTVNKPTLAPMALFGEAGSEAIMPLSRDSSGRLGVQATGNGGTSVHFAPVIHIDSRTDRAEVTALVSRAMKVTKAELVDDLSRKRLLRAS